MKVVCVKIGNWKGVHIRDGKEISNNVGPSVGDELIVIERRQPINLVSFNIYLRLTQESIEEYYYNFVEWPDGWFAQRYFVEIEEQSNINTNKSESEKDIKIQDLIPA